MEGKKSTVRPNGTDSARVIQVIETKSNRGKGTLDDLSRQVVQYWSLEGQLLKEIRIQLRTSNRRMFDHVFDFYLR